MTPEHAQLAYVLAGEAGTCGVMGMLAVAWVYSRNGRMNGYAEPDWRANWVAANWMRLPDVTDGRRFVFSEEDMRLPAVRRIVAAEGRAPPLVIRCRKGLRLYVW